MTDHKLTSFVSYGNLLFKYRNVLFPVILLPLLLCLKPENPEGNIMWGWWMDLLGFLVAMTGQLIRVAVIGLAYIVRGGRDHKVYAEELVTSGIFAHCRNPLYFGNLLILLGLFIIHNNIWVYLIGVPFFLIAYMAIVAAEEFYLASRFGGDYKQYCRSTNRWLPKLKGLVPTLKGMKFHWKRVVAKDYSSFSYWVLAVILIMAEECYYYKDDLNSPIWGIALTIAFVFVVLMFFIARFYKKAGRLID